MEAIHLSVCIRAGEAAAQTVLPDASPIRIQTERSKKEAAVKTKYLDFEAQQSAYLLDYDRRRILNCADTFQELASVMGEMNWEADGGRKNDREELLKLKQAKDTRRQYAAQMRQMAGLMQSVADTSVQLIRLGGRQEKQIVRALAGEGIIVQDIYLLRGQEDRLEISLSVFMRREKNMTVMQIAGYLSVLMNIRLVPEKRNPYFIGCEPVSLYFEEEPEFCCMTAAAAAVEENETVSGDSYSFFEEDSGLTMILSDGVGSGESASKDSSRIVDLTERILDAGLGLRMAVQLLDTMAGAEGDESRMATLDLCRIDLKKAECEIVKAGGAATFIKRSGQVEKISGTRLPLGMFAEGQPVSQMRKLQSGDMIVMISDGVVENWGSDGEFLFARRLEELKISSSADLANSLLRCAIRQCGGKIRDDMTVLAAGVWKEQGREVD